MNKCANQATKQAQFSARETRFNNPSLCACIFSWFTHPSSRRAEISRPLQAIVEIVLISFAAVAMLSFVSKLGDNTSFQQKMLAKEAALTATVAAAAPSSSYVRILHQGLPMGLFSFSYEDNRIGATVTKGGYTITYPFGGLGPHPRQPTKDAFVMAYDGRLSLSDRVPTLPFQQVCPKISPSKRKIYIDAGIVQSSEEQSVKPIIESLLREIPPDSLSVVEQRSAQGLFVPLAERSQSIQDKAQTTISLQFDQNVTQPRIYYLLDASNLQETRKLACALSNTLSTIATPVPMIPVNLAVLGEGDSRLLLDDTQVAVQLVLPPSIGLIPEGTQADNQQMLKQGIYTAIEVYLS